MHATVDPRELLQGLADRRVLASARLVLRGGMVYALDLAGPCGVLVDACLLAAQALPSHRYDESDFAAVERALRAALASAGLAGVRVGLERNAPMYPRPVVDPARVARLLLAVVNERRTRGGETPFDALPEALCDTLGPGHQVDASASAAYEDVLDPHARAWQGSAQAVCGTVPDRLAVYNFIAARPSTSRYRAQALQALPWLLPVLSAPEGGRIVAEVATVRIAIDEAAPLADAVARACGVPAEVVRWLGKRPLPGHWRLDAVRLPSLLAMLSWLPPARRPQSPADFDGLVALCNALAAMLRFDDDRGEQSRAARMRRRGPCMRRWLAECRGSGWAADRLRTDRHRFTLELADVADFLRTLVEATQERSGADEESASAAVLAWCAGIGLRRLLGLSRRWHADALAAAPGSVHEDDILRWPAILPAPLRVGDVTIVELASSAQLEAEGLLMRHCVGSFDRACHRGHSAVVSLRAASGPALSTAELRIVAGERLQVVVEQHRGAHNGAPDDACERALAALVRHLNGDDGQGRLRARNDFQRRQHALALERIAANDVRHHLRQAHVREAAWTLAAGAGDGVSLDDDG